MKIIKNTANVEKFIKKLSMYNFYGWVLFNFIKKLNAPKNSFLKMLEVDAKWNFSWDFVKFY